MPWTAWFFFGLIALTALERLVELRASIRHAAWAFAHGGEEFGQAHYPYMVALHTGFLIAMPLEVWLLSRSVSPVMMGSMLVLAVACQALRWWCISTLGPRWNSRVIVVPGLPRVTDGPYRFTWLRHPNYAVVVTEGVVLPLVHGAWLSATVFTVLNAFLLRERVRVEEGALKKLAEPALWAMPADG
jgi:methyltransferase